MVSQLHIINGNSSFSILKMSYSHVGIKQLRCPICKEPIPAQNSSSPSGIVTFGSSTDRVLSAQTDKILQLRRELGKANNNSNSRRSQGSYHISDYPSSKSDDGLSGNHSKFFRKQPPKPFKFERYVPYDYIHADIKACSIKPTGCCPKKHHHRSSSVKTSYKAEYDDI